jgi:hypothetical protein
MSWLNFTMDLASIPPFEASNKKEVEVVKPENERDSLRKDLGL